MRIWRAYTACVYGVRIWRAERNRDDKATALNNRGFDYSRTRADLLGGNGPEFLAALAIEPTGDLNKLFQRDSAKISVRAQA